MYRSALLALVLFVPSVTAAGTYFTTTYEPSTKAGELIYGVTYTVWIPDGVKTIRGVIVHQHGCGSGACKGGATAAYDLHWQALAKKWNCALLGPSYHQEDGQDCRKWCDPRNGSEKTFLRCLKEFAGKSKHPELETAPWCLWGHSGGGYWASLMQTMHPGRIVAIWFRSGTAYASWEKGEITKPTIPAAAYGIPIVLNPGAKEKDDKRFAGAWNGSMAMFAAYRKLGSPTCFAPDPRTAHECGDSRYLAIPFFDACLALRLPDSGTVLKTIDTEAGWASELLSREAGPAARYREKPDNRNWLPTESVAKAWSQYVATGATEDSTPPPSPTNARQSVDSNGVSLTWEAEADFESGLKGFAILKNGQEIATWPKKPIGRFGRPLFQTMSYHDTPEKPLPEMKFIDAKAMADAKYSIVAINGVGLRSAPTPVKVSK